eukprot:7762285-Karenia_brevis.AAC.1
MKKGPQGHAGSWRVMRGHAGKIRLGRGRPYNQSTPEPNNQSVGIINTPLGPKGPVADICIF